MFSLCTKISTTFTFGRFVNTFSTLVSSKFSFYSRRMSSSYIFICLPFKLFNFLQFTEVRLRIPISQAKDQFLFRTEHSIKSLSCPSIETRKKNFVLTSAYNSQTTPDGTPKVIERFDCSGCGDVDISKKVTASADGTILGLSGRTLKVKQEKIFEIFQLLTPALHSVV